MPWQEDRFYSYEQCPLIPVGLRVPSVSTITNQYPKPWMFAWAKKQGIKGAEHQLAQALSTGTRSHELCHEILLGHKVSLDAEPEAVQRCLEAFYKWMDHSNVKCVDTELVVYHAEHGYAGRVDLTAWVDGEFSLIDFKTSKALYPEHEIQISAYGEAFESCRPHLVGITNKPLCRYVVLKLGKEDGSFEPYDVTAKRKRAFECFLALKTVWEYARDGMDRIALAD